MNKVMSATGSVIIATALSVSAPVQAQTSVADFYSGKTVNLIIGFGAGGGYDTYGRVLAQHMGKHIPGNPTVVPQNMPGAGSIVASNFLYNTAPKDGTTMGMVAASALMQPLFGSSQVKFDSSKFGWLGSMDQSIAFCGVTVASGVESFQDWLKSGKQLAFGASGPAANTFQHPMALRNVLDVNAKVVPGYKGTADVAVAMENGEMDGLCGMQVTSIRSSFQSLIDRGVMRLIIQMGPERTSEFGALPSV
ncbi:MAG: Bug family tripartite tricarboxylate transporter substrate binding protein [Litorivicinaceae bacterium]